ncbi:hypothetical protein MKEN_01242800 [Mycena kentingensis (nom. inval.)]|nr:hypothetical protein MKEN_01242800 [Mycena kentingensis (nom. inval.)]
MEASGPSHQIRLLTPTTTIAPQTRRPASARSVSSNGGMEEGYESDYDGLDEFPTLTEDDLVLVDAACADALAGAVFAEAPTIATPMEEFAALTDADSAKALAPPDIEGDGMEVDLGVAMPTISIELEGSGSTASAPSQASPMARYRRWGTLSVTDLLSLSWCEVQFEYGLQQRRSSRLADRPRSFRSERTGKEIVVQQDVAARNDKTTKRGRFIHKELERELKPEDIRVLITSEEERWAIRLINFVSSLLSLGLEECAREIPVVGLVNGIVVVGIVDELTLNGGSIRVSDTKTRRTDTLPSDEDAEPAKLQLMVYYRLLRAQLDQTTPFDYPTLWTALHLDPAAPFSPEFLAQLDGDTDASLRCLGDVATFVAQRVKEMSLPPLDRTLTIVYRSQNKYGRRPQRTSTVPVDPELAQAIQLSLAQSDAEFEAELQKVLRTSAAELDMPAPQVDPIPEPTTRLPVNTIIGTKDFSMNDAVLDAYLLDAIAWWRGLRKARGVAERQTRRCFSCEYFNDCEWREQKGREMLEEVRRRREAAGQAAF